MPPTENIPPAPQEGSNPPQKPNELDLDAILLPKKEAPQTGERINAGILFAQEKSATLAPTPVEPATPIPPQVKKDPSIVKPLQTFKGDIESLIQDKNVSLVTIAAAEAEKRSQAAQVEEETSGEPSGILVFLRKFLMIVGGIALIAAAGGIGWYSYLKVTETVEVPVDTPAPFISVDTTTVVAQPQATLARTSMMQALDTAKNQSQVSLGLVDRLLPAAITSGPEGEVRTAIPAELFLPLIAPSVPEELVRTLAKEFLLGIHMFDGPQAFIILRTDTYERAFAAMLSWERTMQSELSPLFTRTPRPRLPEEIAMDVGMASSTATTTAPERTTSSLGGFVDKIVENRDTRAVLNSAGDILLLWTFLDRNTIVITTNEYTLREIIGRISVPVTPAP